MQKLTDFPAALANAKDHSGLFIDSSFSPMTIILLWFATKSNAFPPLVD